MRKGERDAQREEITETEKKEGDVERGRLERGGKRVSGARKGEREITHICTNREGNSSFLPETKNKFYIKVQEC